MAGPTMLVRATGGARGSAPGAKVGISMPAMWLWARGTLLPCRRRRNPLRGVPSRRWADDRAAPLAGRPGDYWLGAVRSPRLPVPAVAASSILCLRGHLESEGPSRCGCRSPGKSGGTELWPGPARRGSARRRATGVGRGCLCQSSCLCHRLIFCFATVEHSRSSRWPILDSSYRR